MLKKFNILFNFILFNILGSSQPPAIQSNFRCKWEFAILSGAVSLANLVDEISTFSSAREGIVLKLMAKAPSLTTALVPSACLFVVQILVNITSNNKLIYSEFMTITRRRLGTHATMAFPTSVKVLPLHLLIFVWNVLSLSQGLQ